ncbi:MAG: flippase-like domain-containing protein [Gemmatimonadales bacterium]|nr:flippase-like domain-containing protein [Gemmatimonadales bacterium]
MLGLIVSRIDVGGASVRPTPWLLAAIVGATGLLVMSQMVAALRWKIILGDDTLPWGYLLRLYVIGSFFGLFLPTSVGGDAVRAVATARSSERAGRAIASVLIDRGFGVVATIAYAALGLILAPESIASLAGDAVSWLAPGLAGVGLTLAAVGVAVLILSRSARLLAFWQDGIIALGDLARSPRRLGRVSALAVVSQGFIVLLWYTLARGMNFALPTSTFLWAVPLVSLSALLPITFAGLGVREGVWLVLLAGSAIPPADIVAFSLLYFACNLLVGIAGGILFVSSGMALPPADGALA